MSKELMEILQNSTAAPTKLGLPAFLDDGPPNIYDRIAGLQAEAKELKKADKGMSAQKKLDEAAHFRRLVKKIEKHSKNLGK